MKEEFEKYRSYLANLDLDRDEEDALLGSIWTILQSLVDASFEQDATQLVLAEKREDSGESGANTLSSPQSVTINKNRSRGPS